MASPKPLTSPKPRASVGGAASKAGQRTTQATQQLGTQIAGAGKMLAAAIPPRRQRLSVLRRLFMLAGKMKAFPPHERNQLVDDIAKAIADSSPLRPQHFGCRDWRGLAGLMVQHFERMESLSARTFRAFSAAETRKGHESGLRGMLFNTFVRHFTPLWNDLTAAAKGSVQRLNESLRKTAGKRTNTRLVNARGVAVQDCGAFSTTIRRGREVVIVLRKKGTKGQAPELFEEESIDDVLVTSADRQGGGKYWLFPVEVESKTPAAASGFGKQIANAQVRFGEVEVVRIELTIEGRAKRVTIPADSLVFDLHDSAEWAVSLFSSARWKDELTVSERRELATALKKVNLENLKIISGLSQFRVQSTEKHGGMSFRRLDLALDISHINQIIRAAILAGS